jgi:ferredoxin
MKKTRFLIQFAFLHFTVLCVFFLGANAERWCPFGGVEAIYTYVQEGSLTCSLGVSNFFILGGVLLMTLLLRRAFCGYACPIGAISEWIRLIGNRLKMKPARVPAGLDTFLSLLKYPILAIILYITWTAGELLFRGFDPCYALISRHGEDITVWSYVVLGAIAVGSLFVTVPFCRWLCPLAAVLNPVSRFGLLRVRREAEPCIDCGQCAKACPMAIPVDRGEEVLNARCTACLDCIDVCPTRSDGALKLVAPGFGRRGLSQVVVIFLLLLCFAGAVGGSYLFPLPSFVKERGDAPAGTAELEMKIEGVTCRGSANLLVYYLERDDELEIPGYLRIEAWPGPGAAPVRVTYDPAAADDKAVRSAITEAYFDYDTEMWRESPFVIEGYDPLDLDVDFQF